MSHHFDSPTAIEDGRLNLGDLYVAERPTRSPLRDQVNGYDRILGTHSPMRHWTRSSPTTAS
jgi:hypothetical protein